MRFEGTVEIAAPRDQVWSFLTDPALVSTCAPDLQQLEVIEPDHFKIVVRAGVGPIKGTFTMDVRFTELRAPEHAEVLARGQAPGSAVEMRSTMDLRDLGGGRTAMAWISPESSGCRPRSPSSSFRRGDRNETSSPHSTSAPMITSPSRSA